MVYLDEIRLPATTAAEFDATNVAVVCKHLFFDSAAGIGCLFKNKLAPVAFNRVVQNLAFASNIVNRCDVDHGQFSLCGMMVIINTA